MVRRKKEAGKKWETSSLEADKIRFKTVNKEVKRAVPQAKAESLKYTKNKKHQGDKRRSLK